VNPLHELLADVVRRSPGSPLITYYDDGTGERVELSGATTENWVAKTANLLQEEFGVGPGSPVAVALPPHWQTVVLWLAVWRVGGCLTGLPSLPAGQEQADLVVVAEAHLDAVAESTPCLALSLAPMGRGLSSLVPGVVDYAAEVAGFGDRCPPNDSAGLTALTGPGQRSPASDSLSYDQVADTLRERAESLLLSSQDRVLIAVPAGTTAEPVELLTPLAAGASLVLLLRAAEGSDREQRLTAEERVTRRL